MGKLIHSILSRQIISWAATRWKKYGILPAIFLIVTLIGALIGGWELMVIFVYTMDLLMLVFIIVLLISWLITDLQKKSSEKDDQKHNEVE